MINPNKREKVRLVLNGASKCQGASSNQSVLVGPDLLHSSIRVLQFRQFNYAVLADLDGRFLLVVGAIDQRFLPFLWGRTPQWM